MMPNTTHRRLLVVMTSIAMANSASVVEPYFASWCARQFPDELDFFTGYTMLDVADNHMDVEPYLGFWCFRQFADELQGFDKAKDKISKKHVDVEEFLEFWGEDTLNENEDVMSIEPYIGLWCAAQYPDYISVEENVNVLFRNVDDGNVPVEPLEPVLATWCFDQFEGAFEGDGNMVDILTDLEYNHEPVELDLMDWAIADFLQEDSRNGGFGSFLGGAFTALAAAGVVVLAGAFWKRRRSSAPEDKVVECTNTIPPSHTIS